ncbi:MAG: nitroreductase family protein [Candidatus Bathyarchaeia archaeon]
MDVLEAIKTRRSIRKYKPSSIPDKKLKEILESARLAPSAANRQPWSFIVVRDAERKKTLSKAANNQTFLAEAAVIVVAVGDPEVSKRWFEKDVMIAVEHLVLSAAALGCGTCWIGAFNEAEVKSLLNIPERLGVVALLPIGIPDEAPPTRPRKEFADVFFEDEYGKPLNLR